MKRQSYKKYFAILLSGTVIAQVIGVGVSPILTRIYSTEEYGLYSVYLSTITLLTIFATLRLEFALNIEKKLEKVAIISKLIKRLSVVFSLLYFIIITLSTIFFNINPEYYQMLYLISLGILFNSQLQSTQFILNREKEFSFLSKLRIIQITVTSALAILLGLLNINESGLMISNIVGLLSIVILQNINNKVKDVNNLTDKPTIEEYKTVIKDYKEYPLYNMSSSFLDIGSLQAPIFIFTYFFTSSTVGLYSLTMRTILLPLNLISASLSQVFISKISDLFRLRKSFKYVTYKLLIILSGVSLIFCILLYLSAEVVFQLIFGEEWLQSGTFAKILSFSLFFKFIASPLSVIIILTKEVKILMYLQSVRIITTLLTLVISSAYLDIMQVIIIYTVHEILFYIVYLLIILSITEKYHEKFR